MGDIEGGLAFIPVSHTQSGSFAGWVVQLCGCSEEYNSFALAHMDEQIPSSFQSARVVELFACVDVFDPRCVLSHGDLLAWIKHELFGNIATDRYRWIDFSFALKELS